MDPTLCESPDIAGAAAAARDAARNRLLLKLIFNSFESFVGYRIRIGIPQRG